MREFKGFIWMEFKEFNQSSKSWIHGWNSKSSMARRSPSLPEGNSHWCHQSTPSVNGHYNARRGASLCFPLLSSFTLFYRQLHRTLQCKDDHNSVCICIFCFVFCISIRLHTGALLTPMSCKLMAFLALAGKSAACR